MVGHLKKECPRRRIDVKKGADSLTPAREFALLQSKTETETGTGSLVVVGQLSSSNLCIVETGFGAMLFFACCI